MNNEQTDDLVRRAQVHAALGDVHRLRIVDLLATSDASSSELAAALEIPSNLLAHHLRTLEDAGLVTRRRSEGDGRRTYLSLNRHEAWLVSGAPTASALPAARRVVFVCTANTARSHLAAALWRQASPVAATSAGTHPGDRINPGALADRTTPPPRPPRRRTALPRRHPRRRRPRDHRVRPRPRGARRRRLGALVHPRPRAGREQGGVRGGARCPGRTSGLRGWRPRTRPRDPSLSLPPPRAAARVAAAVPAQTGSVTLSSRASCAMASCLIE